MTFDEGIICLKKYIDQYGTSKVPYTYQTDDKIALGKWVSRQRELYHDGRLSVDKIVKLKELNFVWKVDHKAAQQDNADNSFEEFYNHLKEYKATYGHCDVPQAYQCKDGYRLGAVVNKKRMRPERMSEEQIQMIVDLGFSFKSSNKPWNMTSVLNTVDNPPLKSFICDNLMEVQKLLPGTPVLTVISSEHCFHGYFSNDDSGVAVMIANLVYNFVKHANPMNEECMRSNVAYSMISMMFDSSILDIIGKMKNKIITGPFNSKMYTDQLKYAVSDKDHVADSMRHDSLVASAKDGIKKVQPAINDCLIRIVDAVQEDNILAEDKASVICAAYPLTNNDFMAKECIHHDNSLDDYRKLVAGYIHAFKMCIKPNKKDFTSYLNRAAFTTNTLKMLHNMVIMLTEGATNEDLYYYAEKF